MGSGTSLMGSNFGVLWSPDRQSLVYIKLENDNIHLVVRNLETGKEYNPSKQKFQPYSWRWSPDGNSILVVGKKEDQLGIKGYEGEIFLIDLKTGQTDEILQLSDYEYNLPEDDRFPLTGLEWSLDGKSFYYLFFKDRLVQHDLKSGEDIVLYKNSNFEPDILRLSPDGKRLLFGLAYPGDKKSRLFTIPTAGGKEKEICTAQESKGFNTAFWSPDGKYIYFVELLDNIKTNLWRVLTSGGIPEKVWSSENRVDIFDIDPEGNQIAFSVRERKTEVRMIENLTNEIAGIFK
jgi:Tol biopolymer transport system component